MPAEIVRAPRDRRAAERSARRPRAKRRAHLPVVIALATFLSSSPGTVTAARGDDSAPPPAASPAHGASPRGALLRSALVPGWGQVATGHPLKALIFLSTAAALGSGVAVEIRRANEATDRANHVASGDEATYERYVGERDTHLNKRDDYVSWLLLFWVYNMADAYVEGHFVGFGGLDMRIAPAPTPEPARLRTPSVQIGFHW